MRRSCMFSLMVPMVSFTMRCISSVGAASFSVATLSRSRVPSSWKRLLRATKSVSLVSSSRMPRSGRIREKIFPLLVTRSLFLYGRRQSLLFQQPLGLVEITVGLGERVLAVHHPRPGLLPELLYIGCLDLHGASLYSLYSLSSSISGSSTAGAESSFFASSGL